MCLAMAKMSFTYSAPAAWNVLGKFVSLNLSKSTVKVLEHLVVDALTNDLLPWVCVLYMLVMLNVLLSILTRTLLLKNF